MRKVLVVCILGFMVALLSAFNAQASITVDAVMTVTADNLSHTIYLNGSPITPGANAGDWKKVDVYNLSLNWMETNYLTFHVLNEGANSPRNPAGLLVHIALASGHFAETGTGEIMSTDEDYWKIAPWANLFDIQTPTSYGANSDASTIWYGVNGGPVSGMSADAEWIWTDSNFARGGDDAACVSLALTPVPEPATLLLLGSGLLGLGFFRKKRRAS